MGYVKGTDNYFGTTVDKINDIADTAGIDDNGNKKLTVDSATGKADLAGDLEVNGEIDAANLVVESTLASAVSVRNASGVEAFAVDTIKSIGDGITMISAKNITANLGNDYPDRAFKVTAIDKSVPANYCEYICYTNALNVTPTLNLVNNNVLTLATNANGTIAVVGATDPATKIEFF